MAFQAEGTPIYKYIISLFYATNIQNNLCFIYLIPEAIYVFCNLSRNITLMMLEIEICILIYMYILE